MKTKLKITLFLLMIFLTFTNLSWATPLVDAQWLKENISNVDIVDVRNKSEGIKFIPTSVHSPYSTWRSTKKNNPGELISLENIQKNVASLGLSQYKRIVLVYAGIDASDFGSAARVYWTLKSVGFKDISILEGGFKSWQNLARYELSNTSRKYSHNPNTQVNFNKHWLSEVNDINNAAQIKELLLDARIEPQFLGKIKHPVARTYGTIPNAQLLSNFSWFKKDTSELLAQDELLKIAEQHKLSANQTIHSFCNTGHWAATNWFILSEVLKYPNVKLYPGSFVEYANDKNNTIQNEPNRLVQLYRSVVN